jgi:enoyl-CoA hydratase
VFSPSAAVEAGWLDEVAPSGELLDVAHARAVTYLALDRRAHAASKLRAREATLATLATMIERDDIEFREMIASVATASSD